MNNLQQLMQMGQQLQVRITKLQESLGSQKITASSGGGMVSVTVDGKGELKEILGEVQELKVDLRALRRQRGKG